LISRGLPLDRKLLEVDDLVSVHNFLDKVASLLIVHRPDLLDALVISLLEPLEALLEFDELVSEKLVVLGVVSVFGLGFKLLNLEFLELFTKFLGILVHL